MDAANFPVAAAARSVLKREIRERTMTFDLLFRNPHIILHEVMAVLYRMACIYSSKGCANSKKRTDTTSVTG